MEEKNYYFSGDADNLKNLMIEKMKEQDKRQKSPIEIPKGASVELDGLSKITKEQFSRLCMLIQAATVKGERGTIGINQLYDFLQHEGKLLVCDAYTAGLLRINKIFNKIMHSSTFIKLDAIHATSMICRVSAYPGDIQESELEKLSNYFAKFQRVDSLYWNLTYDYPKKGLIHVMVALSGI